MIISNIQVLDNSNTASSKIYGNKIGVLSQLVNAGVNIPRGYFFNIQSMSGSKRKLNEQAALIFSNMKEKGSNDLIVRSSMSLEDQISHQFPGIFLSKKNIRTSKELIKAIIECAQSKDSDIAYRYVDPLKSVSLRDLKASILVQEQIPISYFGLAEIKRNEYNSKDDFITIEITKNDSLELVQGKIVPSAIRLYRESNYVLLSNSENLDLDNLPINQINRELQKVKNGFPVDSIVEFGIGKNQRDVFIFQAREHEIKGINPLRAHIPKEEKIILPELSRNIESL